MSGQASMEYLLTLAAVLMAFAGVAQVFRDQTERYLSFLYDWIALPF